MCTTISSYSRSAKSLRLSIDSNKLKLNSPTNNAYVVYPMVSLFKILLNGSNARQSSSRGMLPPPLENFLPDVYIWNE